MATLCYKVPNIYKTKSVGFLFLFTPLSNYMQFCFCFLHILHVWNKCFYFYSIVTIIPRLWNACGMNFSCGLLHFYHLDTRYIILSKQDSGVGSLITDSTPTCFFSHSESVWPVIQVAQTLGQVSLDGDAVQWEDVIVCSDTKDWVDDNVASACLLWVSGEENMKKGGKDIHYYWVVLKSRRQQPRPISCQEKGVSKP